MKDLHTALIELKRHAESGTVHTPSVGICYNLFYDSLGNPVRFPDGTSRHLADLCEKWPKYSGARAYPVPGLANPSPFGEYAGHTNKWVGEYGALRMELLDYLIERTKP